VIRNALRDGRTRIVVNCQDLTYISSSGIGSLLGQLAAVREQGGDIKICCTGPRVARIFEVVGMHIVFDMSPTEEEAIAKFENPA
jgi:anti-anti-sigma factor